MEFLTTGAIRAQYNHLGTDGIRSAGLVLSPEDYEHLKAQGEILVTPRPMSKDQTIERILGLRVSPSVAITGGHCMWIGDEHEVLAYTNASGKLEVES